MFEKPLAIIKQEQSVNTSLKDARFPDPYVKRFGVSISTIANQASQLGLVAPPTVKNQIDKTNRKFYKNSLDENGKEIENIYPQLFGNVIEFLTAYQTIGKEQAEVLYFPQCCDHIDDLYFDDPLNAKDKDGVFKGKKDPMKRHRFEDLPEDRQKMIVSDLARLSNILDRIEADPMSYDGICAACEFVAFHNTMNFKRKRYSADGKLPLGHFKRSVVPTKECARRIYRMVQRSIELLNQIGTVQSYQFTYPINMFKSKKNGVNGGRLDFVANNKIVDIKTDKDMEISNSNKLQVLLYLALIQRVKTHRPVEEAAIGAVRSDVCELYNWNDLDDDFKEKLNALIDYTGWSEFTAERPTPAQEYKNGEVRAEVKKIIA